MSQNDKSWENSLREQSPTRSRNYSLELGSPRSRSLGGQKLVRSPMKNTESKDYDSMDFIRKIEQVSHDAHIIADPFKPTLNEWIKDEQPKDCTIHHCKNHIISKDDDKDKKL